MAAMDGLALGVVVIGRNEGERLDRCLVGLEGRFSRLVYVDSGSTDGSVALARRRGAEVVALDSSEPFSAARGRNEGFAALQRSGNTVEWVQFIDGDCQMFERWPTVAIETLRANPKVAIVCGRICERFPEASVYNRMIDIELEKPLGPIKACGGIFMVRANVFKAVGGFDQTITAGEEPEMCQRIKAAGWDILHLAESMAWHDSAMLHFGQWWRRQIRTGYSCLDVSRRFGRGPDRLFVASVRSARLWGMCWPLLVVLTGVGAGMIGGVGWGMVAAALSMLLGGVQVFRIARGVRRTQRPHGLAWGYGVAVLVSKFAHMAGQIRYVRDRLMGRQVVLIEYKTSKTGGSDS